MERRKITLVGVGGLALALLLVPHRGGAAPEDAYYAADTDGIFWFMHVSDAHISSTIIEEDWEPENLVWALDEGLSVIDPVFLVVTGDLVDGSRNEVIPTSGQAQSEWDEYKSIYTNAGMTPDFYYDVVGNHDEYDDMCPSLHWYLDNSLQGQTTGSSHFSWTHTTVHGDYFFYGFNATGGCVPPFTGGDGTVIPEEYSALKAALEANSANHELTFVFAHQAPFEPVNSGPVIDELVKHGVFYVHGHRHEYSEYLAGNITGEFVTHEVDTLGKGQVNNVGVGVVDHNAFIYRATSTAQPWPFVIITAPVAQRLSNNDFNPYAYDVCKDQENPVRALVFAPETPDSVTLQLASEPPIPLTQINEHLWSAMVDTSFLTEGRWFLTVTATVGGQSASDMVGAVFYPGPCVDNTDGGVPQDGGASDASGFPEAGSVDGSATGDAGTGSDAGVGPGNGGCGCRVPTEGPAGSGLMVLTAVLFVAGWRRRRRGC